MSKIKNSWRGQLKESSTGNSTERLLNTIRRKNHGPENVHVSSPIHQNSHSGELNKFSKKHLTLGVFFETKTITFVLASEESSQQRKNLAAKQC